MWSHQRLSISNITAHRFLAEVFRVLRNQQKPICNRTMFRQICVCETRMPPAATIQNMAKISKSYILTPPNPQGQVMSEKCEEPKGELTVQVWLLYHHPNFKYCTLFVSGTELQTNRQTNGQTDRRSDY